MGNIRKIEETNHIKEEKVLNIGKKCFDHDYGNIMYKDPPVLQQAVCGQGGGHAAAEQRRAPRGHRAAGDAAGPPLRLGVRPRQLEHRHHRQGGAVNEPSRSFTVPAKLRRHLLGPIY